MYCYGYRGHEKHVLRTVLRFVRKAPQFDWLLEYATKIAGRARWRIDRYGAGTTELFKRDCMRGMDDMSAVMDLLQFLTTKQSISEFGRPKEASCCDSK